MSYRLACFLVLAFLAVEGFAQPALRPLSADPRLERNAGELDWTLAFEEATTPGVATGVVIAATPDRGVCTLSRESFGPGRGGAVLARYTEAGALRWEQVASATTLLGLQLLDVTAVDEACVSVFVAQTGPRTQHLRIVRAGAEGLDWSYEMNGEFFLSASVLIEADGEGGVWVGFGNSTFVSAEGERPYILRLDADGAVVQTLSFEPPGNSLQPGVRDLAALPDGRAVAVTDLHLLLLLGNETDSTPFSAVDAEYADEGQALDVDSEGGAVYIMGYSAPSQFSVQRFDLQAGTEGFTASRSWETLDAEGGAYLSPHSIGVRGGSLYVLGSNSSITQLATDTGTVQWNSPLPSEMQSCDPRGLFADSQGVVVDVDCQTVWVAAFDENGSRRWRRDTGRSVALTSRNQRSIVPCGDEGTCLAGTRYGAPPQVEVEARAPDEEQRWEAVRQGDPAALHEITEVISAPDGGVYARGLTSTELGGSVPMVLRVDAEGDLLWGGYVEGLQYWPNESLAMDVASNGDLVVGGVSNSINGFAIRVAPSGENRWTSIPSSPFDSESFGPVAAAGVVATDDGGALLLTRDYYERNRLTVTRVGPAGDMEDLLELSAPQDAEVVPYTLERVPGGYVASAWHASDCFSGCKFTFVAHRFDENGTLLRTDEVERFESFEIVPAPAPRRAVDAQGNLYVAADLRGSMGFVLFRIDTNGTVAPAYLDQRQGRSLRSADIRGDGHAVLLYRKEGIYGLTRVSGEGSLLWEVDPIPEEATDSKVAVGLQEGALVAGTRTAGPALTAYQSGPTAQATMLPRVADLPTEAGALTLTPEGIAYVGLRAQSFGSTLAGIARINNALVVSTADNVPRSNAPLLTARGPNPLRAGQPLRLVLGEPATLTLYDLLGRRVATWADVSAGDFQAPLPPALSAGLYVLRAEGEDASATMRVMVLR